jgi:hypothetical protein
MDGCCDSYCDAIDEGRERIAVRERVQTAGDQKREMGEEWRRRTAGEKEQKGVHMSIVLLSP